MATLSVKDRAAARRATSAKGSGAAAPQRRRRNLAQTRGVFTIGVVVQQGAPGLVGRLHGLIAREIPKECRRGAKETLGAIGDGERRRWRLPFRPAAWLTRRCIFSWQTGLVDRFHDTVGIEGGSQIRRRDRPEYRSPGRGNA